uniref:Ycf15 n=1 Tax=Cymbopogon citratus TaxID=66014 RepID=A0A4D6G020_9POAL|nr:Ycf15 [Cymbopogon citratus]QCB91731.1 Ycf15 [Cymbopogon citratus]
MRTQLRCIARIHVPYLKRVDLCASLMVQSSSCGAPFLLGPQRKNECRTGADSSSRKKELTEPGSLTNRIVLLTNTNI